MELRELAERIVFGTSLEEKLIRPGVITDERPGLSLDAPESPSRPIGLKFKECAKGGSTFPGLAGLGSELGRGRILHFFANHELLATELMALVLLRFPDAPIPFRRGILKTLQDEQEHFRLYLGRMQECGTHFGDLPLSGYFWRSISPMGCPMDFVSGLSLTFEQANLDFSRDFAQGFAQVGDTATADLLDRIYRDEIAHVAHGLKWFRRWKNPQHSDWDAFTQALRPPLSPRRARGDTLNAAGRRAAGLDDDFIQRLQTFSRSKGRTPRVFLFNPLAEASIEQGKSPTLSRPQIQLTADLASLPQFLGGDDDIVLVPEVPSPAFLSSLRLAGLPVPEFIRINDAQSLVSRKVGELRPWAWAPDSFQRLHSLSSSVTGTVPTPSKDQLVRQFPLFAKDWSAQFFHKLYPQLKDIAPPSFLNRPDQIGTIADSFDQALDAVQALRGGGHHRVVIKRALGLAGGNALRLWEPELSEAQRRWISASFRRGGRVVIEPWLERTADFSVHFEKGLGELRWVGYAVLHTDHRGQFRANAAEPCFDRRPPTAVLEAFRGRDPLWIHQVFDHIRKHLGKELDAVGYHGPIGIDAFLYREAGMMRMKPVVEINPRYTMGRLTLELMRFVAPGRHGLLRLINRAQLQTAGYSTFSDYAASETAFHPVERSGQPTARLTSGIIPLNDPATACACLALFRVSNQALPLDPSP